MSQPANEDSTLQDAFSILDPNPEQIERMRAAVLAGFHQRRQSLTAEWIDLLRVRPLANSAYAAAAVAALLIGTPLGSIGAVLLRSVIG